MLQGTKRKHQVKGTVRKEQIFGIPRDGPLIRPNCFAGPNIEGGNGKLGQKPEDKVTVGTDVQDFSGLDLRELGGGKAAFIVYKVLGVLARFEDGLGKDLPSRGFLF
jgi:hypothetical protein